MTTCRENINKLKALCDKLEDRDEQLKINASTLWDILANIEDARQALEDISLENESNQTNIDTVVEKLNGISSLVSDRGCKRVKEDA
tara:strand:+ start:317 stop:577 length:261 start_codon:yes stop_codon:yes gene_type:complete